MKHLELKSKDWKMLYAILPSACYPKANKIRLVQDDLNTHNIDSFCEYLEAEDAFLWPSALISIAPQS